MKIRYGWAAGTALAAAAIGLRLRNAWLYGIDMGFDAQGNWAYVEHLRTHWTLPDPAALWSAAHPPLFYALSAGLSALLGDPAKPTVVVATRLLSTAFGLAAIAAIVHMVRRIDPQTPARAWLAGALVLGLPVHVYMSAMLSEEILVSSLTTFVVVGLVLEDRRGAEGGPRLVAVAGLGALAGLALLTKLSGLLIVASGGLAYAVGGLLRGRLGAAIGRSATFGLAAMATGGWFYLDRLLRHGYLYPSGLGVHRLMFEMPPGERTVIDYLRVPLSSLTGPDLLAPELLHSVWGSTYATIWSDGHRHFLPTAAPGLDFALALIGVLAIVPTVAFLHGSVRAMRRVLDAPNTSDVLLLALVVSTLAGYVLFTWRNPWFATVKGSFLLGLAAPFACYASEALVVWGRAARRFGRVGRGALVGALATLWIAVTITFAYDGVFSKREYPGLRWRDVPASGMRADPPRDPSRPVSRGDRAPSPPP